MWKGYGFFAFTLSAGPSGKNGTDAFLITIQGASVRESFLYHVASWSKCDRCLSVYSFESSRCNFKSSILSYENDP